MHLDAQVALLYQMEAGVIALVGGQVKTEGSVAIPEVAARQSVPLVLPHLTGRGEHVHVATDEEFVVEIRLERFGGYLSPVHVHREEAFFADSCRTNRCRRRYRCSTAPNVSTGCEEQVLIRVRSGARGNGVHLAVDGPHRILDRALLEGLDMRRLHGRIQGGLPCKQGGIDDVDPVIGVGPPAMSTNAELLRTSRILTSMPLIKNLSCINRSKSS